MTLVDQPMVAGAVWLSASIKLWAQLKTSHRVGQRDMAVTMITKNGVAFMALLVSSFAIGCGSGGDSAPADGGSGGAGGGNTSDCTAVGAQQKARITALGCLDTSASIRTGCQSLYASNTCITAWEALIGCITPKPNSDFECDADNELAPKAGVCTAERATFDACVRN